MPEKNTPNLPSSSTGKFLRDDGTWQTAGGSFSGTMDDITDGVTYVKTENNYPDADKTEVTNLANGDIDLDTITASTSAGFVLKAVGGSNIAEFGAGGGQNATFEDGVKLNASTANRVLSTDANKNITALNTATYPDLTELSYVKGVTSSIQTQLNGKQASGSYLTSANIVETITNGVTTNAPSENAVFDALAGKQDTLVSATNIKTINGSSVLGSGDLVVSGSQPDIPMVKQVPTANQTITSGYSAYISGIYEIGNGLTLEIQNTAIFEIG